MNRDVTAQKLAYAQTLGTNERDFAFVKLLVDQEEGELPKFRVVSSTYHIPHETHFTGSSIGPALDIYSLVRGKLDCHDVPIFF